MSRKISALKSPAGFQSEKFSSRVFVPFNRIRITRPGRRLETGSLVFTGLGTVFYEFESNQSRFTSILKKDTEFPRRLFKADRNFEGWVPDGGFRPSDSMRTDLSPTENHRKAVPVKHLKNAKFLYYVFGRIDRNVKTSPK